MPPIPPMPAAGAAGSFFFLLCDDTLGGEEHACDRGCILEGYAGNLGRVDDTCGEEVLVYIGAGIVAVVTFAFAYFLNNHCAFNTGVGGNLAEGFFDSAFYDSDTGLLVVVSALEVTQTVEATDVCHATAGNDTFGDSSAG